MGALASAQAASSYLEKLRDKVPLLYERDNVLYTMFQQNADVEVVSPRTMRISLQIRPGGRAGQANMDGGDLGRGSGTTRVEANLSPIFFKFGVEVNKLVEYATNKSGKAVENIAKKEVKNGMAQFRAFLDKLIQTDGTGVLGTVGSVAGGGTQLTMAAPMYSVAFYVGQWCAVLTANFATNRGYVQIDGIDPGPTGAASNVITVSSAATGGATLANIIATDVLVPEGITGTGTPTSLFGLKYHHSGATAGTWLNLNRATYPELRTPYVTANGSLVTGHVRAAKNKIRKALGIDALTQSKIVAYMAVEQEHAWEQLGITISEIIRQGSNQEQPDLLFGKSGTMGGAPIKTSINADPTRIDFIALSNWVRAVIQEIDFYEVGGQTVFPVYGASGGLAAAYLFYYVLGMQLACQNPRLGAYISSLSVPSLY